MSYPLIFDSHETKLNTLGNGVLTDAVFCVVTEELNGSFELELRYPVNGIHSEYLQVNNLLLCEANRQTQRQIFRIYEIKQEITGLATIYARHISYDLNGYPVEPFTATSLTAALSGLMNSPLSQPFSISADFTSNVNFTVDVPSAIRNWFGGRDGSLLDVYGGEWEYNNFSCILRRKRGQDNGVRIQYGKNITRYTKDVKSDVICSHLCAFWYDSDSGVLVRGSYIPTGISEVTKCKFFDLSDSYEEAPSVAELNAYASARVSQYTSAALNVAVGVIPLDNFQDVIDLGDTVHVYYQNDAFVTRCVGVTWNVLKETYDSITIGELKTSIGETINKQTADAGYITKKEVNSLITKATSRVGTLTDSSNSAMPGALLRSGRAVSFLIPYSGVEGCTVNVTALTATIYSTDGSLGNATASDIESATCTPFGIRIVLVKAIGWGGINATPVTVVIGSITAEITR